MRVSVRVACIFHSQKKFGPREPCARGRLAGSFCLPRPLMFSPTIRRRDGAQPAFDAIDGTGLFTPTKVAEDLAAAHDLGSEDLKTNPKLLLGRHTSPTESPDSTSDTSTSEAHDTSPAELEEGYEAFDPRAAVDPHAPISLTPKPQGKAEEPDLLSLLFGDICSCAAARR